MAGVMAATDRSSALGRYEDGMKLRKLVVPSAISAMVGILGACSDDSGGPGGVAGDPAVFVTAGELSCSAGTDGFVRDIGSTINIDLINERDEPTTFAVQLDGGSQPLLTQTVDASTTERVQFKLEDEGNYVLGCGPDEWAGLRVGTNP